MNRTNTRICWLRKPLHIANTGGHFFFFSFSNSYLLLHTEAHYIINTFLGTVPCPRFTQHTLHTSLTYSEQEKKKNKEAIIPLKLFFCGSQATSFRVSCCNALCESCIFSVPGFHVKRSWHATVPDHLERSITQPCQLHPFKYSSFGSL